MREIEQLPDMVRIVVGVDPSGTAGKERDRLSGNDIGIVVAGRDINNNCYVLADLTCNLSPDGWGRRVVDCYHRFTADRVVVERNFGGAMVEYVIRTIDPTIPIKEVVASRGKAQRAEPVAALYEQQKVFHLTHTPELEDEMIAFTSDGYLGSGSPNRVDALVWAVTDLMLQRFRHEGQYETAMPIG